MGMPGQTDPTSTHLAAELGVGYIEVLHPGIAYTWTDDATGIKIKTNLKARDCNRRPGDEDKGIIYFKSDAALWAWALRVSKAATRNRREG